MPAHTLISPGAPDSGAPDVILDPTPPAPGAVANPAGGAATRLQPNDAATTSGSSGSSSSAAPATPLNVLSVALGDRLIRPWYPSLYREELVGTAAVQRLFVCSSCFRYTVDGAAGLAHRVRTPSLAHRTTPHHTTQQSRHFPSRSWGHRR